MLFKNVSGTHVQIAEHRFLQPNATIDLSDDELKNANINHMINQKGWLKPILEQVVTGLITGEVGRITGQPNFNIKFPLSRHDTPEVDVARQKVIDEAIESGKSHKLSDNLPLENPEELDFISEGGHVDSSKEYGNSELNNEYNNPVAHNGDIQPIVYRQTPASVENAIHNTSTALPAVEQYVAEDNKTHAAVTDDIDYSEKATADKPEVEKSPVDKPVNSKKPPMSPKKKD